MWFTKATLFKKPSNLNVRQMVCARCDQFETAVKLALICLAVKAGIILSVFRPAGAVFYRRR